ncbi:hypothetical protein HQ571_04295 [Candidatus Kuenenbacteria bacterium]|nr:hypothetical protein [Candidatus Kuenenbacteria bacterium]
MSTYENRLAKAKVEAEQTAREKASKEASQLANAARCGIHSDIYEDKYEDTFEIVYRDEMMTFEVNEMDSEPDIPEDEDNPHLEEPELMDDLLYDLDRLDEEYEEMEARISAEDPIFDTA